MIGNIGRDLHTLFDSSFPNSHEIDFGDKEFQFAWYLRDTAREQGYDKTADAIEAAMADGDLTLDDGWGPSDDDGKMVMETFAAEARSFGLEHTADAFENDMKNGHITDRELSEGEAAITRDLLGKGGENDLKAIAKHYAEGGIKIEPRRLTRLTSEPIRSNLEAVIERYRDAYPESSAQNAADWAVSVLKDRVFTQIDEGSLSKSVKKDAKSIFENYFDGGKDHNGMKYAIEIAEGVYDND